MTEAIEPKYLKKRELREWGPGRALRYIMDTAASGTPVLLEEGSYAAAQAYAPAFTDPAPGVVAEPAGMSVLVRPNRAMSVNCGGRVAQYDEKQPSKRPGEIFSRPQKSTGKIFNRKEGQ